MRLCWAEVLHIRSTPSLILEVLEVGWKGCRVRTYAAVAHCLSILHTNIATVFKAEGLLRTRKTGVALVVGNVAVGVLAPAHFCVFGS